MKIKCFLLLLSAACVQAATAQVHQHKELADSVCEEDELHVKLSEVVVNGVTGQSLLRESPLPFMVVSQKELQAASSTNIIDAIARMPGVSQLTTGGGISKPVIRGLGYNRVAVVSDGIRQEGQQWGDEHGVEIDAAGVGSVEILKGPASLMYGSDALAGVVVFRPYPVLPQGTVRGSVQTGYQTNNGLLDYSLNFGGNRGGTVWDVRYSEKYAHAYKNKVDGYVPSSQFSERAASALVGVNRQWGHSHLKLSYYHLTPGIVEGERDEDSGELLPKGFSGKRYGKSLPYQQVHHYKAVWDNTLLAGEGRVNALVGYQQNRRQEFEADEEGGGGECELDFRLHTVNYDVRYISPDVATHWKLAAGVNGMWQQSQNLGEEALIPAYRLFDLGMFATATGTWERWTLSGGLRYDRRWLAADAREEQFVKFRRNLAGLTGSVGMTYCVSNSMHLRVNASRGFRAPNLSELGANGVHEGSLRYERGNRMLSPEQSWQLDLGLDYSSHVVTAQLSLFASHISNFIFLQRDPAMSFADVDAEDDEEAGAAGGDVVPTKYPVYGYSAGTARLWGGEATVVVHPVRRLHLENTFSYVATRLLHRPEGERYLPTTPQPRWTATLKCDLLRECRHVANSYASIGMDCFLRQNRVFAANDTETPTPSYTLLNLSAGTDILGRSSGRQAGDGRRRTLCTVSLTVGNLLDRAYQSHLSRLKYADVNPVTGRRGVSNMGRNIGVKLSVPIR